MGAIRSSRSSLALGPHPGRSAGIGHRPARRWDAADIPVSG
ncbi:protein of unassigned function [Methylobacterium oryzae CBMB20]|uniref:Protein of unassigned function n=1 Tax=Methylobacterium oryzae CBMB20 TaxID=693986 RepID=A0A089NQR4_9HYPH|nr:protein of unassigned function [Methylobacterium oryzae CBMB20]